MAQFSQLHWLYSSPMSDTIHLLEIERCAGEKNDSSYIVRLKTEVDKSTHLAWLRQRLGRSSQITHEYDSGFLNAYAGKFEDETLNHLRASPDVENISEVWISVASPQP